MYNVDPPAVKLADSIVVRPSKGYNTITSPPSGIRGIFEIYER
jgi:hypothetical protein